MEVHLGNTSDYPKNDQEEKENNKGRKKKIPLRLKFQTPFFIPMAYPPGPSCSKAGQRYPLNKSLSSG